MRRRYVLAAIYSAFVLSLLPAGHAAGRPATGPSARTLAAADSTQCIGAKAAGPFHVAGAQVRNAAGKLFVRLPAPGDVVETEVVEPSAIPYDAVPAL